MDGCIFVSHFYAIIVFPQCRWSSLWAECLCIATFIQQTYRLWKEKQRNLYGCGEGWNDKLYELHRLNTNGFRHFEILFIFLTEKRSDVIREHALILFEFQELSRLVMTWFLHRLRERFIFSVCFWHFEQCSNLSHFPGSIKV